MIIFLLILTILIGIVHALREAFHADPYIFERKFKASRESFFGADAWKRNYKNNDPSKSHKNNLFNSFRDFWHSSWITIKFSIIFVIFSIGSMDINFIARWLLLLLFLVIQPIFSYISYNYIRK